MENYGVIMERYRRDLEKPSVESSLMHLVLDSVPSWSLEDHQQVHDDYFRQKSWRNGLRVPPALEAGSCLTLAERYRQAGDAEQARHLITAAVENHPGHTALHNLEQNFDADAEISWKKVIAHELAEKGDDGDYC